MEEHGSASRGSPGSPHDAAPKTSITCNNMPESLFDVSVAKRHFGKFGRVTKILLRPKKQTCVIDYESHIAAQKALLNAGAYDGYMFDVTWTKKKKKRVKKEQDPDWAPDSDVEEELTAMSSVPVYRAPRQPMQQDKPPPASTAMKVQRGRPAATSNSKDRPVPTNSAAQQAPDVPSVVAVSTTMSTAEAAAELKQLSVRVSRTPDEQRRTLDARDRVLRAWGGTGARVRVGGATIGTCRDMCPEKERLQRQAEHQVMLLELEEGGAMAEQRAVKQYSRSSADQETPMCYELRPPSTLARTMAYLLREVADCTLTQVSLADWFHFMWDRCRGIRKDITQQALCCAESVRLVEQCARFHAHCGARLAGLEHAQFDQRLNTDNLTKCLQSLKHMYADLPAADKPREAEFRSYVALLNLGDANFCWEIKQLSQDIQKSEAITFAVEIFMALDNNNYVRFFRLIRNKATYLQACILLRYFNDVRARGLARIVKAFAPRGGSKYPVKDLMENLAFEDLDGLKSFISHYGLNLSRHDDELSVILDRNNFIEDSDPYPISRAINLIESKRNCSVGEIIAGGTLPDKSTYDNHVIHSSFTENGTLKPSALLAEDQGYGTNNESNKNLNVLRKELERTPQQEVNYASVSNSFRGNEPKVNMFTKSDLKLPHIAKQSNATQDNKVTSALTKQFSFKPAITVVSSEILNSSPENKFTADTKTTFSFSKPVPNESYGLWGANNSKEASNPGVTFPKTEVTNTVFGNQTNFENAGIIKGNIFSKPLATNPVFCKNESASSLFIRAANKTTGSLDKPHQENMNSQSSNLFKISSNKTPFSNSGNVFANINENNKLFQANENSTSLFAKGVNTTNVFGKTEISADKDKNIFGSRPLESEKSGSIPRPTLFGQSTELPNKFDPASANIFSSVSTPAQPEFRQIKPVGNLFAQADTNLSKSDPRSIFGNTVNPIAVSNAPPSPRSLFKSSVSIDLTSKPLGSSMFAQNRVLSEAFGPISQQPHNFGSLNTSTSPLVQDDQLIKQRQDEMKRNMELEEKRRFEESQRIEEQMRMEKKRQQEKIEELKMQEEKRKLQQEAQKLKELRWLEEEKRQAELKRKAEEIQRAKEEIKKAEENKRLIEHIEKESEELVDELTIDINTEIVKELITEEMDELKNLLAFANIVNEQLIDEITNEICLAETKAEKYLSEKLMSKYADIWKMYTARNIRRRNMVQETPVWLAERSPLESASFLRRQVLPAVLAQMNAFHKGYRFSGKPRLELKLKPYNIMEVVRSSLLKGLCRVKQQYHECFFWKVTISSPGPGQWLNNQLEIHNWIKIKFSDKDSNDFDGVMYLKKHSWNNLMHFVISAAITEDANNDCLNESNGVLFYATEGDKELLHRIKEDLQKKRSKHLLPLAVVASCGTSDTERFLTQVLHKDITSYRIFKIDKINTNDSINSCTKSALKWLAKNTPGVPPLEIDSLKSILLQCIGNELWFRLKLERPTRRNTLYRELPKLICLYNVALEKLADAITNDNIFTYPSFPVEFKKFLLPNSTLPTSYEYFPNNWVNLEYLKLIKKIITSLKLPQSDSLKNPKNYMELQAQIHDFCNSINWFENPSGIAYKIISHLPQDLCNPDGSESEFLQCFSYYDFLDVLNIAVVEKINCTSIINEKFVIYDKGALCDYRNGHWLHEIELVSAVKHKALNYIPDDIDNALNESFSISAKRIKYDDSDDLLMLEDIDESLAENSICKWDSEIDKLSACKTTVFELEKHLEAEAVKSSNLEELLRSALYD